MKKLLFFILILVATVTSSADVHFIYVMTVQNGFLLRCVVTDEEGKDLLVWIVHDFKDLDANAQNEKKYRLEISHIEAESLVALVKNSEDFKNKNQQKKDGSVGLGQGFIISLEDGIPPSSKTLARYDLPPDMRSPDLDKLKALVKWEEIKSLTKR